MSKVSICNKALSYLGGRLITSLDDTTREAQLCKAVFDSARDACLEARDWSFALERTQLVQNAIKPDWGWGNAFTLPADCIRVIEARNDKQTFKQNIMDWELNGNEILCNSDSLQIRYLKRVEDTARYTPNFADALSARIAHDIAGALTQSTKLVEQAYIMYEKKLTEAAALDGMQGRNRRIRSNKLTNARAAGYQNTAGPYV